MEKLKTSWLVGLDKLIQRQSKICYVYSYIEDFNNLSHEIVREVQELEREQIDLHMVRPNKDCGSYIKI